MCLGGHVVYGYGPVAQLCFLPSWLAASKALSFLPHTWQREQSQVPARRQLSELAAIFSSKGQSGRGGRVRSVRG